MHEGAKQFVIQELIKLHALIRNSEGCVPTTEDIPKIVAEAWPWNSEVSTFVSVDAWKGSFAVSVTIRCTLQLGVQVIVL